MGWEFFDYFLRLPHYVQVWAVRVWMVEARGTSGVDSQRIQVAFSDGSGEGVHRIPSPAIDACDQSLHGSAPQAIGLSNASGDAGAREAARTDRASRKDQTQLERFV